MVIWCVHHSLVEPSAGCVAGNNSSRVGSREDVAAVSWEVGSDTIVSEGTEDVVSGNGGSGCSVVRPSDSVVISKPLSDGHGTCHCHGSPC